MSMYKLTLVGDTNVGKTSIVTRMTHNTFFDVHESTIGAAYSTMTTKEFKVCMWDTSGQVRYQSICPIYYRKSDIILICYDVTNQSSINQVTYWMKELNRFFYDDERMPYFIIVGNKTDLLSDGSMDYNLLFHSKYPTAITLTVSAKTGEGITVLHSEIVRCLAELHKEISPATTSNILLQQSRRSLCAGRFCISG